MREYYKPFDSVTILRQNKTDKQLLELRRLNPLKTEEMECEETTGPETTKQCLKREIKYEIY